MRPLRHGYTNDTRGDGTVVVKRYSGPDWQARLATEQATLSALDGRLLAPRLTLAGPDFLEMEHLPGVHGQDLIDAGHAAEVLRSCGQTLRTIQAYAAPPVLVHGDFGPNNTLFDPDTFATTAVLDWEWSHPGEPIEDLAWCEWIVRMHHPDSVTALDALFAGYGSRPPWPARQRAAAAKCRRMLAIPRPAGAPGTERWRDFLAITESWTEAP
jgi:aminoglycoside phosphotransferase (APT) family kinase protein